MIQWWWPQDHWMMMTPPPRSASAPMGADQWITRHFLTSTAALQWPSSPPTVHCIAHTLCTMWLYEWKWNTFNKTQWLKIVTVFQCDLKPRTKAVHPKLRDNCTHYKRWCCICIYICICVCICMTVYKKLNVLHLQWPAASSWRATGNKRWGCLPLHAYYPPPYHTSAQTPL